MESPQLRVIHFLILDVLNALTSVSSIFLFLANLSTILLSVKLVASVLLSLHTLFVANIIALRILLITYKVLNGFAPTT